MTYPKPRLIKNPTAVWEQPEPRFNWFDWLCAGVCVALTLGTVAYIYGVSS